MTTYIISQSWNNEVATNLSFTAYPYSKVDMFANKDGIHMVVRYYEYPAGEFYKYYLINSSGTVVKSTTFTTESSAEFPKISGDNDKVYLAYKFGNELRVKKSTDAGTSWSTDIQSLSLGSNGCNGVDIVYDYQGLHVVYAMQDNGSSFETYYYKLNTNNAWVDYKNVTDYNSDEVGGFPTVSVSPNRVHVSYNTGIHYEPTGNRGTAKTRDKFNSSWEDPQEIFGLPAGESMIERVHAGNTKLFDFYYKFEGGMGQYHSDLYVKERSLGTTTWSSGTLLSTFVSGDELVSSANTAEGNTYIVYPGTGSVKYRTYNNSAWSSENTISSNGYKSPTISTTSNDVFVTWGNPNNTISYRQYDAVPLAPQNANSVWYNSHPKITWTANMEPDIASYKIYKKVEGATGWANVATVDYSSNTSSYEWVDTYVNPGGRFDPQYNIHYKVTAKDITNKESNHSAETIITGSTYYLWKQNNGEGNQVQVKEYSLQQNYPNPFNPSTQISYQIPIDGLVTLKVYDVLGNEVAVLVNEWQEPGSYSTQFTTNGKQLSSGMSSKGGYASGVYFYTLTAGKFTDTKKFILLK
jgi:hypothetical protein